MHAQGMMILQTSKHTKDVGALQKGADFVKAYALGFDVNVRRLHESDISLISASRTLSPSCDWTTSISTRSK